jgi:tetratricopeptide (TPR) repeat protein
MTQTQRTETVLVLRFRCFMLISSGSINLGDYAKALKLYNIAEEEIMNSFTEPEVSLKLSTVYLNIGICYIYMNNPNIAEKYLRSALTKSEGILGNEVIYKLHADINENLGVAYEQSSKSKEALNCYKKSLKTKFSLYGESHEEVLDLQYKISNLYFLNKQFKEAEEIMSSMSDVILKEKLHTVDSHLLYRYGSYFYLTGVILMKNNKNILAKEYFIRALKIWNDILNKSDPVIASIQAMLKVCEKSKI